MSDVADKLQESDSPFASYASELSDQLCSFSNKLSTSSIDDLVGGARSLARDNPAAFMLGSMAIGLAASRFFKATGEELSRQSHESAARPDIHHADHGSDQRHEYNPGGMRDTGAETHSRHARTNAAGPADTTSSSASSHALDQRNADNMGQPDHVAGHNDCLTSEEA